MKVIHVVFLSAILINIPALAQSHGRQQQESQATDQFSKAPASGLNFAKAVPYYSGGNGANAAAIAELRGTGQPLDVVLSNWCSDANCTGGSVAVLLGKGDGTFQPPVRYPSGGLFADFVVVADLNGDGHLDLVVANCGSNSHCGSYCGAT